MTESDSQDVLSFWVIPERNWGASVLFKKRSRSQRAIMEKSRICLFLKIQKVSSKLPQIVESCAIFVITKPSSMSVQSRLSGGIRETSLDRMLTSLRREGEAETSVRG